MDDREQLRQAFNESFKRWQIELPPDATAPGAVWLIVSASWTVWTLFGAEDGREYLDYYAMHRMTDDRHVRLYANGESEDLPAISGMYVIPQGATKAEQAELKARHYAHNQEVQRILDEKGFVMTDQAHPSAIVNRMLQTDPEAGKQS